MTLPYINAIGDSSVNATNFINQLYSKKMLLRFYAKTALMQIANTNYEGEIKGSGSKVTIRGRPEVNIHDYNGTIDEYQHLKSGKVELNIDKAKYYAFIEDAVLQAQADIAYINAATEDAAKKMVIEIEQDVFADIKADFLPGMTVTENAVTKNNVVDLIVHMGTLMDETHQDDADRNMVLPPWMCEMIKVSELKDASVTGDRSSILRNGGKLGMIDRWNIICNTNLAVDGSTGATAAMGMNKHFLTFASQFENHETVKLQNAFGIGHRGLKVFGYKGGVQPECGVLMNVKKAG